jgi:hypothetical protein
LTPIETLPSVAHDLTMALLRRRRTAESPLTCRPGLRVRLRTSWAAAELDEALANGADPLASAELTLRAQQLVDPAKRAGLARSLDVIAKEVETGGLSPQPGPTILRRDPILPNCRRLRALARRLRDDGLHCLPGLAMADRMITFGDSPLYMALGPLQLKHRVEEIAAALDPGWDGRPADFPMDSRWPT